MLPSITDDGNKNMVSICLCRSVYSYLSDRKLGIYIGYLESVLKMSMFVLYINLQLLYVTE